MRLYDETCLALCEGQYIDIWTSGHDDPMTVELYFDMIGRKTAALISAAIEAGALLATDDEAVISRYRAFGWALGLAFQLNDDLLGIWGEESATGKAPSDIAKHKKTLPIVYAFEQAGATDRLRLGPGLSRPGTIGRSGVPTSWPSSSGRAPGPIPATRPGATGTRRWPSSTPPGSSCPRPGPPSRRSCSGSSAPE